MEEALVFVVVHKSDTALAETAAIDSASCILKFFAMDGMGKYIDEGWKKAMRDGYKLETMKLVPKGDSDDN